MKTILSICAAASLALTFSATASTLQTAEGKVTFIEGQYFLSNATQQQKLTGMSLQELRAYEGKTIKVAGEPNSDAMEIYKIFVKTDSGYETSYDWDVVNQDLYAD